MISDSTMSVTAAIKKLKVLYTIIRTGAYQPCILTLSMIMSVMMARKISVNIFRYQNVTPDVNNALIPFSV
jgi:hypothetical protein